MEHLDGEEVIAAGADRFRKAEVLDVLTEAGNDWPGSVRLPNFPRQCRV